MVKCGLGEAKKMKNRQIDLWKGYSNLPTGVNSGSFVKEVGSEFVRVQNNYGCAQSVDVNNIRICARR
jgi:hypothetical protein